VHSAKARPDHVAAAEPATNEVLLVGRVSGTPEAREMPSGDEMVQFRVVIRRPPAKKRPGRGTPAADDEGSVTGGTGTSTSTGTSKGTRAQVDTIDVACWSASSRRAAHRFAAGDVVEVQGALRRRFYRAGAATVSRYEVEAVTVRRHASDPTGRQGRSPGRSAGGSAG